MASNPSSPRTSQTDVYLTNSQGNSIVVIPPTEPVTPLALPEPVHALETRQVEHEVPSYFVQDDRLSLRTQREDTDARFTEVGRNTNPDLPPYLPPPRRPAPRRRLVWLTRIFKFFGFGSQNKARKQLVSFILALIIDFSQVRGTQYHLMLREWLVDVHSTLHSDYSHNCAPGSFWKSSESHIG